MKIMCIDIGTVNVGVAAYCTERNIFFYFDKLQLVQKQKEVKNEGMYFDLVQKKIFHDRNFLNAFKQVDEVYIEHQMKRKMAVLFHIIRTIVKIVYFKPCEGIAAQSVKRTFHIGTGQHKSNKFAAIKYIYEYYNSYYKKIIHQKKDDVCDAMLMCLYKAIKSGDEEANALLLKSLSDRNIEYLEKKKKKSKTKPKTIKVRKRKVPGDSDVARKKTKSS